MRWVVVGALLLVGVARGQDTPTPTQTPAPTATPAGKCVCVGRPMPPVAGWRESHQLVGCSIVYPRTPNASPIPCVWGGSGTPPPTMKVTVE